MRTRKPIKTYDIENFYNNFNSISDEIINSSNAIQLESKNGKLCVIGFDDFVNMLSLIIREHNQ